jgi:hypothetical protein
MRTPAPGAGAGECREGRRLQQLNKIIANPYDALVIRITFPLRELPMISAKNSIMKNAKRELRFAS